MVLSFEIIILNLVFVTALTADSTENLTASPQIVQAHPINLGNISQNGQIFTQKNSLANRDAGKNTTSTSETETTTVESTTTEYDDSVIEDENIAVLNTPYIDDIDAVAKTTPAELIETKTTLFNKIIYTEQKPAAEENQTSRKATMSNDWIWIILLVASLLCLCVIFAKMAYTRYHSNTYYTYEPVSGRALLALSTSRQPRHRD
ncbi:uncharacterized protein LOC105383305 isoform X4 [Plutella xylostella]|uniref:uncharacterized protein LOC105383305 isoform X4 n=1 Tax=Plutella xylostella TaxID=51655 RepID=UPI002032DA63|nr:uncharacterized protein LOC105383305 isoform X4 [Plutella xylostella]